MREVIVNGNMRLGEHNNRLEVSRLFKQKKSRPGRQLKKYVVIRYKNKGLVTLKELIDQYNRVKRSNPDVDVFIEVNK